jgi:hypothetical protein
MTAGKIAVHGHRRPAQLRAIRNDGMVSSRLAAVLRM